MPSNLLLTGGINHDFADSAAALAEVLADVGFESEVTDDIDAGLALLAAENFDLVTFFTLRWRMLDDDKYIPFRDEWAYEISETDRNSILKHLARGGGLLGLHTAAICFDTWPAWQEVLGARWVWQRSFHPPPESLDITVNTDHPITRSLNNFVVTDELYHYIQPAPDSRTLLTAASQHENDVQKIAFAHETGSGRSVYSSLGHDRASIQSPGHAAFLQSAASWCVKREADISTTN